MLAKKTDRQEFSLRSGSSIPEMDAKKTFKKLLSLNDTGETGAHMGGILVPKTELAFFPRLDVTTKNPRATITARDPEGHDWKLNFIYYNNALFGGTRNEWRLTGLTGFIAKHSLSAGETIVLEKTADEYRIYPERANDESGSESEVTTPVVTKKSGPTAEKAVSHTHGIRPAARIIQTVGQNLIKDAEAAVIELVKNAYDADATEVDIAFAQQSSADGKKQLRITVRDNGHGMSYDVVVGTWLVPATDDKVRRRISPGGRPLQGNKGIGRFAAFILGEEIFLSTKHRGTETSLLLQASDFRETEFLDEVRVIVDTAHIQDEAATGTVFEMTTTEGSETFRRWAKVDFDKLRTDLRRMLFPFRARKESFRVTVSYSGFGSDVMPDGKEEIEALPVFDFFDYRITATVNNDGYVSGTFASPLLPGAPKEKLDFYLEELPGKPCGSVFVDIRVVDREVPALQSLLDRSRHEGEMLDVTRMELKRLLNEASGVSVFRGDFRIRPYGDPGDDWLELDRRRINNPTLAVSNNQTFGLAQIEEESRSHLQETSARDGLREDDHYTRFKHIVWHIVSELQRRRFEIRRSVGRVKQSPKISRLLFELKDVEKTVEKIGEFLRSAGLPEEKIQQIGGIVRKAEEAKEDIFAKIEETIAIYQGQATLGKMVGVLIHEGNRDVGIIRNSAGRIPNWVELLATSTQPKTTLHEVVKELGSVETASKSLADLFARIEPLGVRSRGPAKKISLRRVVDTVTAASLKGKAIEIVVEIDPEFQIIAWEQDLYTIFLNLIDNSVTWLERAKTKKPQIRFVLDQSQDVTSLHISDNGPGIPREHILSEAIFEPQFSLRGGTGIGLPIAGEAAARNGFSLRACHSEVGAHFILDLSHPQEES
jgi:signal transduction histidine kinase